MFNNNKYTKWYYQIIKNRKSNPLPKTIYQEKHHIIPKSLGGDNSIANIVSLSAREHFVCHRLLVKMTSGKDKIKMSYAIRMMGRVKNHYQHRHKITSKIYELILEETKLCLSENNTGVNNPFYGKKHSTETKLIMKSKRAEQIPPMLGKHRSLETKNKLRDATLMQFASDTAREHNRQKSLKFFENPIHRYNAGNGKRGKSWYYDPESGHSILAFQIDIPKNYIKGRKIKK